MKAYARLANYKSMYEKLYSYHVLEWPVTIFFNARIIRTCATLNFMGCSVINLDDYRIEFDSDAQCVYIYFNHVILPRKRVSIIKWELGFWSDVVVFEYGPLL